MKYIKGFTLLELLMVLAIFSIVMSGLYSVFTSQRDSYIAQEEVAAMQQNLRAAMYLLIKDVRMANCYLGEQGIQWSNDGGDTMSYIMGIQSWNGGTTDNPDSSDIIDIAFANFNVQSNPQPNNAGKYMPIPSAELPVDEHSMPDKDTGQCPTYDADGYYQECFQENDLVVISNAWNANLMKITQVQPGQNPKLQHNPGANGDGINWAANKNWPEGEDKYGAGTKVFKVRYLSYRIMRTDPKHPSLSLCNEVQPMGVPPLQRTCYTLPIADNIEDMQIAYKFDDDQWDNVIDPNPMNPHHFSHLKSVRISLVARSNQPISYYKGGAVKLEDSTINLSADGYLRRTYTMEVTGRNLPANIGN